MAVTPGDQSMPEPPPAKPSRVPARARHTYDWGAEKARRGQLWIANQEPASRKGATIGWVRRYQAADGQLYALLLSAYFFLTMIPVLLVTASYAYHDPSALAHRVEHRLGLRGQTADLFSTVMVGVGEHKISAVAIAIIDLFFFGLGFARVYQLVQARSWGIDLRKSVIADQARYASVLAAMVCGVIVFVVQTRALRGDPSWIGWLLDVVWLGLLLLFFVWAPRLLLHHRVSARDLLPGAIFTAGRPDRAAAHLVPALHALAELVLGHVRCVRDHHRGVLLDHPRGNDARPRRGAVAGPRRAARPARGARVRQHIPTRQKETEMSTSTVELFVATYGTEDGAAAAAKDFKAAQRAGAIDLIDAAVIVHTAEGKVKFEETADPSGKKWAKRGAIAGGVVGLIFPPSIIVSAAVGGGAGGIWGKIRDKGFKDEDLKEIGNSLPPGSSAIIAIAEDRMVEQLERALGGYEKIAKHAVSAEAAAAIVAEVDDSG